MLRLGARDAAYHLPPADPPERPVESLRREMALLDEAVGGPANDPVGYRTAWRELDAALAERPDRFIGFRSVRLDVEPERR